MKTFSVAVAVAVVLTFVCLQESSAVPVTEEQDAEVTMEYQQIPVYSWKMPYNDRQKRSAAGCRWCCDCCPGQTICGFCCKN